MYNTNACKPNSKLGSCSKELARNTIFAARTLSGQMTRKKGGEIGGNGGDFDFFIKNPCIYGKKVVPLQAFLMKEELTHEGLVREIIGNLVRVEIVQQAACAACKAKSMCSASESKVKEINAIMLEPMQVGDRIEVAVEKRLGWKAVLLAFIIPFCLLLALVAVLPNWIASEAVVGTIAIASLAPYYFILHLFSKRLEREYRFVARHLPDSK